MIGPVETDIKVLKLHNRTCGGDMDVIWAAQERTFVVELLNFPLEAFARISFSICPG
jgi:hypothetical protein